MRVIMLAVIVAGCSGSGTGTGGPDDVSVTIYSAGAPVRGAQVVFHASDGAVIATAMTDDAGHASYPMPDGGMVTVPAAVLSLDGGALSDARTQMYPHWLTTFAGVIPGEQIVIGKPPPATPLVSTRAIVSLPGAYAGATSYHVDTGCS